MRRWACLAESLFTQRACKVGACRKSIGRIFFERSRQHLVERTQVRTYVRHCWRFGVEVAADGDSPVGIAEGRGPCEHVKCAGRQRVLIRPTVKVFAHKLFG
jgi:hypothetical protein